MSTSNDGAPQLRFTWDPAKAASNLGKHGVSFAQAATVLLDALALTVFDAGHSEFEERWFTLGLTSEGRLLAVSHTYTAWDRIPPGCGSFRRARPRATSADSMRTSRDEPR